MLDYTLIRKKIKKINLRVEQDGSLRVSAPIRESKANIDAFVLSQKEWIIKTREKLKERKTSYSPFQNIYENGQELSVFGEKVILHLEESLLSSIHLQGNHCYIFFRKEEKNDLNRKIQNYFQNLLYEYLQEQLQKYSYEMELYPKAFIVKHLKSAWGIYHRRKNYISFSSLLLSQSREFISYVVIHELAHIRHMNHQKEFWVLVEKYCPSYRQIKKLAQD